MTQTVITSARTAAVAVADATDIVVTDKPKVVSVFASDGTISAGYLFPIYRKIGSNLQPVPDGPRGLCLTRQKTEIGLLLPGTYRIAKPVTTENIGFAVDDTE